MICNLDTHIRSVGGRYKRATGKRAQTISYISRFKVYKSMILSIEKEKQLDSDWETEQ